MASLRIFKLPEEISVLILILAFIKTGSSIEVTITTDDPVILGSSLVVRVRVENDIFPYHYYYEFQDDVKPKSSSFSTFDDYDLTISIPYDNEKIVPDFYHLHIRISNAFGKVDGWIIYENTIRFCITDHIIGKIQVKQVENDSSYVSTNQNMTAMANIHDPHNFFDQYTLTYSWYIDQVVVPGQKQESLSYHFPRPVDKNLSVIIEAKNGSNTYYGNCSRLILPRDPVEIYNLKGKLFIEHGELLHVSILFKGSKPFSYCWHVYQSPDEATRRSCIPATYTDDEYINITHYVRSTGEYTLLVVVANDINRQDKLYTIKISDIVKQHTLSFIILPVVCSILAIVIILAGVGLHVRFRRKYMIEVADFDFILHDEDLIERTFFERVARVFSSSRTNRNLNPVEVAE